MTFYLSSPIFDLAQVFSNAQANISTEYDLLGHYYSCAKFKSDPPLPVGIQ